MSSEDLGSSNTNQSNSQRRKPAKRPPRAFVEEPLYLLPAHYALLQDSTYELMRGLAGLSTAVEDDPLYFDQLLGAAVNVKHAFDLGRMDVINGTIRPRNTSLCHECITTVSSVWRSGPEGPRTLCNACGLRYYKQNQRRALEARRREMRETSDVAAASTDIGAPTPGSSVSTHLAQSTINSNSRITELDDVAIECDPPDNPITRLSPELTRPSIANLCDPPSDHSRRGIPFIPSISNILASPSQTPEPSNSSHNSSCQ
ncbi:white collar 2 type of transcription factor [Coemansia sp. RSA 988]|nr:white collar 2 type of transcription factor [Coemansia sp. RSA 988]